VESDLTFALQVTITGLLVVFTALVGVALIVMLFQRLENVGDSPAPSAAPDVAKQAPAAAQQESSMPAGSEEHNSPSPEVIAVISAAVATATGKKVRIHRVRYRASLNRQDGGSGIEWTTSGRVALMASRTPRN
jgi:cytoskeletal protein RodZ